MINELVSDKMVVIFNYTIVDFDYHVCGMCKKCSYSRDKLHSQNLNLFDL